MIPLITAILVLSVGIFISQKCLLRKEWYLWVCMIIETYMRGNPESKKLEILQKAGRNRFPATSKILPNRMYQRVMCYAEKDLRENYNSMKNYYVLVQGIALYHKDYTFILRLIEDVGKREKA